MFSDLGWSESGNRTTAVCCRFASVKSGCGWMLLHGRKKRTMMAEVRFAVERRNYASTAARLTGVKRPFAPGGDKAEAGCRGEISLFSLWFPPSPPLPSSSELAIIVFGPVLFSKEKMASDRGAPQALCRRCSSSACSRRNDTLQLERPKAALYQQPSSLARQAQPPKATEDAKVPRSKDYT